MNTQQIDRSNIDMEAIPDPRIATIAPLADATHHHGIALSSMPVRPYLSLREAHPPGISPMPQENWLDVREDHAGQMAARDALVAAAPDLVHATTSAGEDAAAELRDMVIAEHCARHSARLEGQNFIRPDGVSVDISADPMEVAGRLGQEDFAIMLRAEDEDEHRFVAGFIAFPAHWTLREKIGKLLVPMHVAVASYDPVLARKVQRFFDGVKDNRPLWRANWNFQTDASLFTPVLERYKGFPRPAIEAPERWLRVERQTIRRLPQTGAVVFGIRTYFTNIENLAAEDWQGMQRYMETATEAQRDFKCTIALRERMAASQVSA